jgi:hypothetical protein
LRLCQDSEISFDESRPPLGSNDDASFFEGEGDQDQDNDHDATTADGGWGYPMAAGAEDDLLPVPQSPCGSAKSSFNSPPCSPSRATASNSSLDFALNRRSVCRGIGTLGSAPNRRGTLEQLHQK